MSKNDPHTTPLPSRSKRLPIWGRTLLGAAVLAVMAGGMGTLSALPSDGAAVASSAIPASPPGAQPTASSATPMAAPEQAVVAGLSSTLTPVAPATSAAPLAVAFNAASNPTRPDLSAYEMPADVVPANTEGSTENPPFARIFLPAISNGQDAIDALGANLPSIAAWYGKSGDELRQLLLSDRSVHVDRRGRLLHIDTGVAVAPNQPTASNHAAAAGELPEGTAGAAGTQLLEVFTGAVPSTTGAPFATDQTFLLHSRSASKKVVYLNFRGEGTKPAFSLDTVPGTFTKDEMALIQRIWLRVAEDYAAFDVDVTTEAPAAGSGKVGTKILITRDLTQSAGGYAYLNTFSSSTLGATAYCFQNNLANAEKPIAECLSHEVGHTLGLLHQSTVTTTYYGGSGSGDTGWAPIMGVSYYKNLTQWAKGEFPGATNKQDAYAVMATSGLKARVDDHGNTIAKATAATVGTVTGQLTLSMAGVIEAPGDVDMFSFKAGAGPVSLSAKPSAWSGNVDVSMDLLDATGKVLASGNPAALLSTTITFNLPAKGTYYVSIKGVGQGTPSQGGYSNYGSVGQYVVTGSAAP